MRNWLQILGLKPDQLLTPDQLRAARRTLCRRYYVYALWRSDRSEPTPFYVGKGKGERVVSHLNPCRVGESPVKDRIFAKLARKGIEPLFCILASGLSEAAAHTEEMRLIRLLGRIDRRTGPLSNLTDGGEGMSGHRGLRGAENPSSRAVIAEGRPFSCCAEADRILGLSKGRTRDRIEHGWQGYHRADEAPKVCRRGRRKGASNPKSRPVYVDGVLYQTLSAAAAALGVHSSAVHKRINFGWPGYYYQDEGQKPRSRPPIYSPEHNAKMRDAQASYGRPVNVAGVRYPSIGHAANTLGLTKHQIRARCRSKNFPDYQLVA